MTYSDISYNKRYSDENDSRNSVMFVTGQPEVKKFLFDIFTNENLPFKKDFVVLPDAVTRERAIDFASERRPKLIIFFETTVGNISISETIHRLRLTGARVIYISTQRAIGDLVLEALVECGVYDLVLDESISIDKLIDYVYNPRQYQDVAAFRRYKVVPDSGSGQTSFVIPNLSDIRRFSGRFTNDYLLDPVAQAVEGVGNRIVDDTVNQSFGQRIFSQTDNSNILNNQRQQLVYTNPQPKQQPQNVDFGDLPEEFDF